MKYNCAVCGKEFRAKPCRNRKYCSVHCYNVAKTGHDDVGTKTVPCSYCGKEFTRKISALEKYENNYCSHKCSSLHRRTRVKVDCKWCGRKFTTIPSDLDEGVTMCSKQCRTDEANSRRKRTCVICGSKFMLTYPSHKTVTCSAECGIETRRKAIYKPCKQCGTVICVTPSTNKQKIFCSIECQSEWRSENNVGENNPNWKNGLSNFPYPLGWNKKLKKRIRDRDGQVCQECGSTKRLTVHHIGYDKDNLAEDNLITLCTVCNSKANANRSYWQEHYSNMLEVNYGS